MHRKGTPILLSLIAFVAACSSSGGGTTGGDPCAIGCDKATAAKCPKDKPASCLTECNAVLAEADKSGCGAQARAYFDCIVAGPFVCDTSGYAQPTNEASCKPQESAFDKCADGDAAVPPPPLDTGTDTATDG